MWYTILQLLNYIGIITNAFIIAVTSSFGGKYKTTTVFNVLNNTTSTNSTTSMVNTTTESVSTLHNLWIIIVFQVCIHELYLINLKFCCILSPFSLPLSPLRIWLTTLSLLTLRDKIDQSSQVFPFVTIILLFFRNMLRYSFVLNCLICVC